MYPEPDDRLTVVALSYRPAYCLPLNLCARIMRAIYAFCTFAKSARGLIESLPVSGQNKNTQFGKCLERILTNNLKLLSDRIFRVDFTAQITRPLSIFPYITLANSALLKLTHLTLQVKGKESNKPELQASITLVSASKLISSGEAATDRVFRISNALMPK